MSLPEIFQEWEIKTKADMEELWLFFKANAWRYAKANQFLHVIATTEEMDRLDEQIAFYFGYIVKPLAEQIFVDGKKYSIECWHEYLAEKFLPRKELVLPDGKTYLKRGSVARGKIGVRAMAKYVLECSAYATSEHGIIIEDKAP